MIKWPRTILFNFNQILFLRYFLNNLFLHDYRIQILRRHRQLHNTLTRLKFIFDWGFLALVHDYVDLVCFRDGFDSYLVNIWAIFRHIQQIIVHRLTLRYQELIKSIIIPHMVYSAHSALMVLVFILQERGGNSAVKRVGVLLHFFHFQIL